MSAPGAVSIGLMRSDSGEAGPREVKLARLPSQSVVPKTVEQSVSDAPTATMFFAVAGGDTWMGTGLFASKSKADPSNRSGMARSHWVDRSSDGRAPVFPAGTNTM